MIAASCCAWPLLGPGFLLFFRSSSATLLALKLTSFTLQVQGHRSSNRSDRTDQKKDCTEAAVLFALLSMLLMHHRQRCRTYSSLVTAGMFELIPTFRLVVKRL